VLAADRADAAASRGERGHDRIAQLVGTRRGQPQPAKLFRAGGRCLSWRGGAQVRIDRGEGRVDRRRVPGDL
jgi:hypothetical protein